MILLPALMAAWLFFPRVTQAQGETPYDLINAVNDLRALHGLEPYQIDPWLMAYAQEHTDYQASMQTSTHRHSDGTLPWDIGLQENVASGDEGIVTVSVVVYEIWVDWGHRHILTGYSSGEIGAGVALTDNGQVYYTVDIRPGEGAQTVVPEQGTDVPFVPYGTCTPNADGSIIHTVSNGQTLWSIAISYGVRVDDIRRLNGIPGDSNVIQVGQKLLVRPATTLTPALLVGTSFAATQLPVDTAIPPTGTMPPTETVTPSPSKTVVPTSTPADASSKNTSDGTVLVLVIAMVVLLVVFIFSFRKPRAGQG